MFDLYIYLLSSKTIFTTLGYMDGWKLGWAILNQLSNNDDQKKLTSIGICEM